jgi:hypothetical protein
MKLLGGGKTLSELEDNRPEGSGSASFPPRNWCDGASLVGGLGTGGWTCVKY